MKALKFIEALNYEIEEFVREVGLLEGRCAIRPANVDYNPLTGELTAKRGIKTFRRELTACVSGIDGQKVEFQRSEIERCG